jgi:hypothetical protein
LMAWSSTAGFHQRSSITTRDAPAEGGGVSRKRVEEGQVRFKPTPPAFKEIKMALMDVSDLKVASEVLLSQPLRSPPPPHISLLQAHGPIQTDKRYFMSLESNLHEVQHRLQPSAPPPLPHSPLAVNNRLAQRPLLILSQQNLHKLCYFATLAPLLFDINGESTTPRQRHDFTPSPLQKDSTNGTRRAALPCRHAKEALAAKNVCARRDDGVFGCFWRRVSRRERGGLAQTDWALKRLSIFDVVDNRARKRRFVTFVRPPPHEPAASAPKVSVVR